MFDSCLKKQQAIKELFNSCSSEESKYHKIIELGRQLPSIQEKDRVPSNIVKGCQSMVYLCSYWADDKIIFEAESDALISAGLAAILLRVYSEETPESILKCPPAYLDELGIRTSLTPNRANGLYSIHLRMKQDALRLLIEREAKKDG